MPQTNLPKTGELRTTREDKMKKVEYNVTITQTAYPLFIQNSLEKVRETGKTKR